MEKFEQKLIEKMAKMENSFTKTFLANNRSFKLWNIVKCSKFIKLYSPKIQDDNIKQKKKTLSCKRLSRRKGAIRRRQMLKIIKIMEELLNKNTQIVHEPDSSIDVEEFIQYPPDIIALEPNNPNQNTEDISQNDIKIKEECPKNYNEISIKKTEKYENEVKMKQLQNSIRKVEEPSKACNEMETEQLQNYKKIKTEHLQNCEEMKIKPLQKYKEIRKEQLQSCKEVEMKQPKNYEEIETMLLKDDYKIEIMQLQNCNQTERTKSHSQKDKLDGRCIVNFSYLLNEIHRTFDNHAHGVECQFKDWKLIRTCRYGLLTKFIFKCQMCNYMDAIWSEPKETDVLDINTAAIAGGLEMGMGFSKLKRFCTKMNITCMSEKTYIKYRNALDGKDESKND